MQLIERWFYYSAMFAFTVAVWLGLYLVALECFGG